MGLDDHFWRRFSRNLSDECPVHIYCKHCFGTGLAEEVYTDKIINAPCDHCASTGVAPIPFSELFHAQKTSA